MNLFSITYLRSLFLLLGMFCFWHFCFIGSLSLFSSMLSSASETNAFCESYKFDEKFSVVDFKKPPTTVNYNKCILRIILNCKLYPAHSESKENMELWLFLVMLTHFSLLLFWKSTCLKYLLFISCLLGEGQHLEKISSTSSALWRSFCDHGNRGPGKGSVQQEFSHISAERQWNKSWL